MCPRCPCTASLSSALACRQGQCCQIWTAAPYHRSQVSPGRLCCGPGQPEQSLQPHVNLQICMTAHLDSCLILQDFALALSRQCPNCFQFPCRPPIGGKRASLKCGSARQWAGRGVPRMGRDDYCHGNLFLFRGGKRTIFLLLKTSSHLMECQMRRWLVSLFLPKHPCEFYSTQYIWFGYNYFFSKKKEKEKEFTRGMKII